MAARKVALKRPRYVLIIEDNVHHAELLTEVLDRHFAPVIIHTVDTISDGLEFAAQAIYDLVLTGAVIRETPITDALQKLHRLVEGAPLIVISGRGDERLAAELIKRGATEYLVKSRDTLEHLPELLERHLSGRKRATKRESRKPLKAVQQRLPSPSAIIREVDKLTQQALSIAEPRRRKRPSRAQNLEQLDQLLNQIRRLRDMASKLIPKEKE